jgi:hypothetical protein
MSLECYDKIYGELPKNIKMNNEIQKEIIDTCALEKAKVEFQEDLKKIDNNNIGTTCSRNNATRPEVCSKIKLRVASLNENLRAEVSSKRHLGVFDQNPYKVVNVDEYDRTQTEEVRKFLQKFKQDPTSNEKTPTPPSNSEWWRLWRGGKKKSNSKKNKSRSKKMKTKSRSSSRR